MNNKQQSLGRSMNRKEESVILTLIAGILDIEPSENVMACATED